MKKIIHVHQQRLRQGLTPLIVRTYKGVRYGRSVKINGPSTLRWVGDGKPLSCGARAWIETEADVEVEE